ncbi:Hypothetical predicted protein [Pelobates cultripes]|uniref:Uncharacterized protein n=1 Tax=Pelobates cultripes TaxID=61616 RepID=A0AAD1SJW4_PELCU|nr:Hypothetical predicted protein [Pelobates cultripes]
MDEINLIRCWSRYNAKIQTLQQKLELPSPQNAKVLEDKINPRWARYNSQVQTLQNKLGLNSHTIPEEKTFHKSKSHTLIADKTSRYAFRSTQKFPARREMQKEVLKYFGPSAVDTMMQSYSEGFNLKDAEAFPRQEMIDKVLIKRSISRAENQKQNDNAVRKLNEAKEHLMKALKKLEIQNEFFGNGGGLQDKTPPTVIPSSNIRKECVNISLPGTDLLKDLEKDDLLLDDIIKEIMTAHLPHVPDKAAPSLTKELRAKVTSERCLEHAALLAAEEIILEVTLEMTKQQLTDVMKRLSLNAQFESQFDSAEVQDYLKKSNPLHF